MSKPAIPVRHVIAVVIGNGLEFYDFLTYAIFAVYIGRTFTPSSAGEWGLLISLAIFGAGFITRPLGGIILGSLGDRIGRKQVMFVSFVLIGVGMAGLALTPPYAQIGIAAPLIVLFFRLIQGFALGGEIGPTTAYMIESAPEERRGFYGSMQFASQNAAVLIASIIGVALANLLNPEQLQSWGWRVAFLAGVIIVPFGVMIRRNLPETLHAADDAALAPDATTGTLTLRARIAPYRKVLVLCFVLLMTGAIGTYLQDYMTTYALDTLHMSAGVAFGATVVSASITMILQPVAGTLSDRIGRKPLMIYPSLLLIVLIVPAFWTISHFRTPGVLYGFIAAMAVIYAFCQAPVVVALTESLPARIRSGAVATVYAFAISLFGGSTQFVITWIIKATHNPMAPAYYWTVAVLFGIVAALLMPESAPVILKRRGKT